MKGRRENLGEENEEVVYTNGGKQMGRKKIKGGIGSAKDGEWITSGKRGGVYERAPARGWLKEGAIRERRAVK